ncbi:hypothetical protein COV17_04105 [Candidatus Woesearchaeota archaeon CG10_big_fil_rev_8_21_14_0_10_36_11]|nr:MAG: hypothetical protein COV17_04105 [Candidatus Woesearchaeota archaeon CG10_big_fil_rev_8_21_14_0_10_36_11]
MDGFGQRFNILYGSELDEKTEDEVLTYVVSKFHDELAKRVSAGENVVIDHFLQEPHWAEDFADKFADYKVILIRIECPLDVLKLREKKRDDYRKEGTAEYHFNRVHINRQYDFEVNTASMPSVKCAEAIVSYLENPNNSNERTTRQKVLGKEN